MAFAVDSHSQGSAVTGSTVTWAHTCASGAVLYVGAGTNNQTQTVTGVTYNGTSMSLVDQIANTDACYGSIWFLSNPSSGSNNIVVTYSASSTDSKGGVGVSFTGSDTTFGAKNKTGVDPGDSSISTAVTTTAANSIIFAIAVQNGNSTSLTVSGTNQTQQDTTGKLLGAGGFVRVSGSTQTTTTTGSYTSSWSSSPNEVMVQVAVEVLAASAAGPTNLKSFDGNVKSNIKSFDGNTLANIKSIDGNS